MSLLGYRFPGAFRAVTEFFGLRAARAVKSEVQPIRTRFARTAKARRSRGSNLAMATIDSNGGSRRTRATNHDPPLVPFIDFLLCLVTFLLATAGFANFARLSSSANVPGKHSDIPEALSKRLHVDVREHVFRVSWQSGATVLESQDVPLDPVELVRGGRRYPELARFLDRDWRANGAHRDPADPSPDQAVLHVRNSAEYEDVVAVLDALRSPQRAFPGLEQAPVFAVSFAAD